MCAVQKYDHSKDRRENGGEYAIGWNAIDCFNCVGINPSLYDKSGASDPHERLIRCFVFGLRVVCVVLCSGGSSK